MLGSVLLLTAFMVWLAAIALVTWLGTLRGHRWQWCLCGALILGPLALPLLLLTPPRRTIHD